MGRSRPQRRAAALGAAVAILAMLLVAPSSAQQAGAAGPAAAAAAAAAPATAPSAVAPGPLAGDAAVWPAGSIPNWDGPGPIRVCTSEFTPSECCCELLAAAASPAPPASLTNAGIFPAAWAVVYCVDRDPDAYTGYEIELFRKVARIMGWEPGMLQVRGRGLRNLLAPACHVPRRAQRAAVLRTAPRLAPSSRSCVA